MLELDLSRSGYGKITIKHVLHRGRDTRLRCGDSNNHLEELDDGNTDWGQTMIKPPVDFIPRASRCPYLSGRVKGSSEIPQGKSRGLKSRCRERLLLYYCAVFRDLSVGALIS